MFGIHGEIVLNVEYLIKIIKNRGFSYLNAFYYFKKIIQHKSIAKAQEMLFWKNELSPKHKNTRKDRFQRDKDLDLCLELVKKNFRVLGNDIKVLDVGPGPRSLLKIGYEKGDFDLIGIDPLADDYKKEFNGGDFLISGSGEEIEDFFKPNSFHIVYSSNALDHCIDPHIVVRGVLKVLKPSGFFIVCGNANEGTRSYWQGFHKHDLWIQGDALFHSGQDNNVSTLIGEGFQLVNKRDLIYDWEGDKIKWFSGIWVKR